MSLDVVVAMLAISVTRATPLALGALSGLMSERAGVVNIAIEGIMLSGAFAGFLIGVYTHSLLLAVLGALAVGGLMALLHALLSITFRVDQIISGTVINILAVGITGVYYRTFIQQQNVAGPGTLPVWKIPFLANLQIGRAHV